MPVVHIALITVSILFSIGYIVAKIALESVPAGAWAFYRVVGAAAVMGLLNWTRLRQLTKKDWLQILPLGALGILVNQVCFMEGLSRTTPIHAALMNTTIPVCTLGIAILLKREKLYWTRAVGIILSLAGVLVLLEIEKQHFGSTTFLGDLLCFCNALSFSFYLVLSKDVNRRLPAFAVTAGMFILGAIMMIPYGIHFAAPVPLSVWTAQLCGLLLFVIFCNSIATYYLNNWALARVESSRVALYIYVQPLVTAMLSRVIYHEKPTTRLFITAFLIFSGVLLGNVNTSSRSQH